MISTNNPPSNTGDRQALLTKLDKTLSQYAIGEIDTIWELREAIIHFIDAYTEQRVREAKYDVLQDLLDWHNQWFNTHNKDDPFNWYGAIKAMQVMKDPQKPFHTLAQLKASTRKEEQI